MGNSPVAPSMPPGDEASAPPATGIRSPRRLRWFRFTVVVVVLVAAIATVGYVFLAPLLLAPDQYWDGVRQRYSDLLSVYPLVLAVAIALLLLVIIVSLFFRRRGQTDASRGERAVAVEVDPLLAPPDPPPPARVVDAGPVIPAAITTDAAARDTSLPDQPQSAAIGEQGDIPQPARQQAAQADASGLTHRVFLSSTVVDLAAHRARVHDDLERLNQFAVDMAQFGAGGADATTVSYTELATAEFVVLIVAWRYGFIPNGETHSITHLEYEEARRLGLPVFVYLSDPSTEADDGPDALFPASTRVSKHAEQLAAFRKELQDPNVNTCDTFTTPEDLSARVVTALARRLLREARAGQRQGPDASGRVLDLVDMPQHGQFIGREQELDDLLLRLRRGDAVGVFAVEGMGGVGKTALAAEAVERLATDERAFPGGVLWVACAGLEGETGLLSLLTQVARSLGRADIASLTDLSEVRRALSTALRSRPQTLLTLDNVEPGLDAEVALQTLRAPGHTTLLLTARDQVAPNLVEVVRLAPLPSPEAAELFERRLAQETQGARPTNEERTEVVPLVEAVGGLPLAVELLAADAGRQGTSLQGLRVELTQRGIDAAAFRADPKHIVTEVFDRSWIRLPESQRRLFAGLGLLAEVGFPRVAAEALAVAAEEGDKSTVAPSDAVRSLVRAGLVEPLLGDRLRLHPLLRAYARDKLAGLGQETADALGDALLAYWLDYAKAHPSQRGNDPAGMDAQEAEAAGLMGALEWAHQHARNRVLLDLVYALYFTWYVRGRRAEERQFGPWAVEAAQTLRNLQDQRFAMHQLAVLDAQTGNIPAARAGFEEALRLARKMRNKGAIRMELHELALLDFQADNEAAARSGYEEALRLARDLGDEGAILEELHGLAVLDTEAGNEAAARSGYEEALRLARDLGNLSAEAVEMRNLADAYRRWGQTDEARTLLQDGLAISKRLNSPYQIGMTFMFLGRLEQQEGRTNAAIAQYRAALSALEPIQSSFAEEAREALRELGAEP
ncbi:MAG TPA: DUF4062 domain-containing protein [Ktedonobacterales bacterium]|jgi:tetratricopeptide (TPR) repeat protein